jgi:cytochrome oxidase assembly protein ShyY1
MSHASRWAWTVAGLMLLMSASVVISIVLTRWQVEHSQVQWCDTLRLLTSHPVPKPSDPAVNPSRYQDYQYYQNFLTLRRRFGC